MARNDNTKANERQQGRPSKTNSPHRPGGGKPRTTETGGANNGGQAKRMTDKERKRRG
jgi:hypothetical protein